MKKMLLINGSPNEFGNTYQELCRIKDEFQRQGVESDILFLGTAPIADCGGDGSCGPTGRCGYNDIVNEVNAKMDQYHGMVVATPVFFGGPTGRITSFLNRLFYCSRETDRFAGKVGYAVAFPAEEGDLAVARINKYFEAAGMTVLRSGANVELMSTETILDGADLAIMACDRNNRYTYQNEAAAKYFGKLFGRDNFVGEDLNKCHPPEAMAAINRLFTAFDNGRQLSYYKLAHPKIEGGETKIIQVPIRKDGKVTGMLELCFESSLEPGGRGERDHPHSEYKK